MRPSDPFSYKRFNRIDPRRALFTIYARAAEWVCKWLFEASQLPNVSTCDPADSVVNYPANETAVTNDQMKELIAAVDSTEPLGGEIVEVGAYRGVTTEVLAARASRPYNAVDPYIGYGGAEEDMQAMTARTSTLTNVKHLRMTSGQAAAFMKGRAISFVFIDAVHDYVNARFDAAVWTELLCAGGLAAFHDTDSAAFAGVQRVVWNLLQDRRAFELHAHVRGLVIVRKLTS